MERGRRVCACIPKFSVVRDIKIACCFFRPNYIHSTSNDIHIDRAGAKTGGHKAVLYTENVAGGVTESFQNVGGCKGVYDVLTLQKYRGGKSSPKGGKGLNAAL